MEAVFKFKMQTTFKMKAAFKTEPAFKTGAMATFKMDVLIKVII